MMFKSSILAVAIACLTVLSVTPSAEAHVGLKKPCPRYGAFKGCPAPPKGQAIDYDINSPVGTYDRIDQPLCKHTVPGTKRAVYKAGQTIKTEYSVGAAHGGGHCQWALSYDKGKTWVVIKTVIRDCLRNVKNGAPYSVNVKIPSNAPSGNNVIFQWIWNNAIGNRELYSNCADINIKGKNGGKLTGVAPLIANYGRKSFYIPEFPNSKDKDGHEAFAKRKRVTITVPKMK
ncbi:hypothetical protein BGZ51_002127 [Haplosporangium sp. Z 767]|nr:hypothetical protein BGZ51_002127 [Haplosporangium sp. Z 767]KAF9195183.1 hypothetical protein BGZ50_005017 [Haplosporangium sp. Z 11]